MMRYWVLWSERLLNHSSYHHCYPQNVFLLQGFQSWIAVIPLHLNHYIGEIRVPKPTIALSHDTATSLIGRYNSVPNSNLFFNRYDAPARKFMDSSVSVFYIPFHSPHFIFSVVILFVFQKYWLLFWIKNYRKKAATILSTIPSKI